MAVHRCHDLLQVVVDLDHASAATLVHAATGFQMLFPTGWLGPVSFVCQKSPCLVGLLTRPVSRHTNPLCFVVIPSCVERPAPHSKTDSLFVL